MQSATLTGGVLNKTFLIQLVLQVVNNSINIYIILIKRNQSRKATEALNANPCREQLKEESIL